MMETPEDIKQLEKRIADMQAKEAELRHEGAREKTKSRVSRIGLRICADLLSAVIVGTGLGYVLDKWLDTKPWCLVVFLIFGGAAGILNVYRLVKAEEDKIRS